MSFYRYGRSRSPFSPDIPGTNFIIIANVVTFILIFLRLFPIALVELLTSTTFEAWHSPWTFFTYPLVFFPEGALSFINLVFSVLWLFFVGGMLERAWGTRRFLFVFFIFSAISAVLLSIGGLFLGINVGIGQLYTPLVALTVIWALLDPTATVLFFFFPMQLRWLALLVVAMSFFDYGQSSPLLGVFSLGGPAAAYLYMNGRRLFSPRRRVYRDYSPPPKSGKPFSLNPLEWYRRWKFKRRFRKLWGD